MATREERTTAYRRVVMALIKAATMDAYVERTAIAKAMDALGPIISDVGPRVAYLAQAFRNGLLLRDHQPINEYLKVDPQPVVWSFSMEQVLAIDIYKTVCPNLRSFLIHEAHKQVKERCPRMMDGFSTSWTGRVEVDGKDFVVNLYPDISAAQLAEAPEPTQPGLLPTMLVEFGWVLGIINLAETVEQTISYYARDLLQDRKPDEYAKLTEDWWAKVEVTDIGYLVTFHYDKEMP